MPDYTATYHSTDIAKGVPIELTTLKATDFHAACAEARAHAERHPYVAAVSVWSEDGAQAKFPVNVRRTVG